MYWLTVHRLVTKATVSLTKTGFDRPMQCQLVQMGSRPITFLWLWPATDHEPHCRHVPINKIWRWTESTPRSRWWRSHMAGIYSNCSTREIIILVHFFWSIRLCWKCCYWHHGANIGKSQLLQRYICICDSEKYWTNCFRQAVVSHLESSTGNIHLLERNM